MRSCVIGTFFFFFWAPFSSIYSLLVIKLKCWLALSSFPFFQWKSWFDFINLDGTRPLKVEPLFISKVSFEVFFFFLKLKKPDYMMHALVYLVYLCSAMWSRIWDFMMHALIYLVYLCSAMWSGIWDFNRLFSKLVKLYNALPIFRWIFLWNI